MALEVKDTFEDWKDLFSTKAKDELCDHSRQLEEKDKEIGKLKGDLDDGMQATDQLKGVLSNSVRVFFY